MLLVAQLAWAKHQVEHHSHDSAEICALCVHTDRGDDQAGCPATFEVIETQATVFLDLEYLPFTSVTTHPHYRSRASP